MDIFISNVPVQASERQIRTTLKPHLAGRAIDVFHVHKLRNNRSAILTVSDASQGLAFLNDFGSLSSMQRMFVPRIAIQLLNSTLYMRPGNRQPDELMLRSLKKEAEDRSAIRGQSMAQPAPQSDNKHKLQYTAFSCGRWVYPDGVLRFCPHATVSVTGTIEFGAKRLMLESEVAFSYDQGIVFNQYRLHFHYYTILSVTVGRYPTQSITLSLSEAPRMYHTTFLAEEWIRVDGITQEHVKASGNCLVYHIQLPPGPTLERFKRLCLEDARLPAWVPLDIDPIRGLKPEQHMQQLQDYLRANKLGFDFALRFQLQRLATNGYLTHQQTLDFIRSSEDILSGPDRSVSAEAIRKTAENIPFAGPDTDSHAYSPLELRRQFLECLEQCKRDPTYNHASLRNHSHIRLIHRAIVTPTGVYLRGPEPETIHRIIRKYPNHADHFLRVEFGDEDFEPLHFERSVSISSIIRKRFRAILDSGIHVVGRKFDFLGFSHSSLRAWSVWLMSPISIDGRTVNARDAIAALGDFSQFRSPAKCAARIGQAFTDTTGVVKIPQGSVSVANDVERNGRCFSDGVGTISRSILKLIWENHERSGRLQPTLYQIRFAGAKGMLALDTRLEGEALILRPSMVKFGGTPYSDLEICGASTRPLPLYLNRQYISIFESLGVPATTFLSLQSEAVSKLRRATENPVNAASFLRSEHVCLLSGTPDMILNLSYAGFDYRGDPFLQGVVELVALSNLRDIKHKARIPVSNGALLYGIMDETDTLKEQEIFCRLEGRVIKGKIVVARSPTLHPGDAQIATAVTVPDGSPLMALDNCVIFSQRGPRDLPSQLSGGDLDGDQFAVFWDERLMLPRTVVPADYPRVNPVDIGRAVTVADMTEFFLNFLENDQLGRIATLHVQLADLYGVEHRDCLILAEMHSTAVDFSKTGVPVDMSKFPKYRRIRPDFMAPSPRAIMNEGLVELESMMSLNGIDEEDDRDPDSHNLRYYKSQKALGKLYREIDEKEFLTYMHQQAQSVGSKRQDHEKFIVRLWKYIQNETADVRWKHLREWASDVKELYESRLLDTMHQFSGSGADSITEVEIFVGKLLGRHGGMATRRTRDAMSGMKEKYERDLSLTISSIRKGFDEDGTSKDDVLSRAMACLAVGMENIQTYDLRKAKVELRSFKYVAAAICLSQLFKNEDDEVLWVGRSS